MRKVSGKHVQWLQKELPILEEHGVLSNDIVRGINRYYAEKTASGLHWAVIAFSILGSLLIGSGIILLFAHNWDELNQPTRAALSFCPLILGGFMSVLALKKNGGVAFRESAGIFHTLAIGASIALIGQTYHIPGNTPGFLLTWALLALPLTFLLSSTGVLLIYLGLICGWSGTAQYSYGQAIGFWILILPAIGKVCAMIRVQKNEPDTLVSLFGLLITLCIATGIVFERTIPGLWIIAYSALFSGAALWGLRLYGDQSGWSNPAKTFGIIGIALLTYLFTWTEMWQDIGWYNIKSGWYHKSWGIGLDLVITLVLLTGWIVAAVKSFRKDSLETITLALFPVIGTVCFLLGSNSGNQANVITTLIFNAFMLFFGLMYIVIGCRNTQMRQLNGGMAIVALLLVTRFFDQDFGFLARGVVFIVLGISFLLANLFMAGRKRSKGVLR